MSLLIKVLFVLAIVAAVAGGVEWLRHDGAMNERAKNEAENSREALKRAGEIAGLNQDLSDAVKERLAARAASDIQVASLRAERKARLNEFVPKTADSATCLRLGWVRYIDAAAAGVPLGAGLGPGAANTPAGVETDAAAGIISDNYATCRTYKERAANILQNFDTIRTKTNTVVDRINTRLQKAERKVQ